jgi:cobalt-zinc-cadmium efflux system membrane fusion protein
VSERQLQLAKSERAQQQSRLTALSQKLPLLGFSLSRIEAGDFTPYLTIKAPETGIVNQVFLTNGQFAETNTPILSLIRPEHVHLELDVFEAEASLIQEGQQLRFRLAGQSAAKLGSVWRKGEVFRVNPVIQGQDRTLMVHAHVPDWEQPLIGAYVEAEIIVKQARFFALPEAALLKKMDAYFVQLQAKGSNESMQLQLQLATESVQALEAVKEGYILAEFVEEIDQEVEYEILYTQN